MENRFSLVRRNCPSGLGRTPEAVSSRYPQNAMPEMAKIYVNCALDEIVRNVIRDGWKGVPGDGLLLAGGATPATGYGRLRSAGQALDMRIATGENLNTKYAFANLIGKQGADILQPDNRRAGGVFEWMDSAAIAGGYEVEVASHSGGSANLNMLLAMPNSIYMETGPRKKKDDQRRGPVARRTRHEQ